MLIHMLSQRLPPDSITGAPMQALQLAEALRRRGDKVQLFTTQPVIGRLPSAPGVSVLPYLPVTGLRAASRFASALLASPWIARADVVHGHSLSPTVLAYAMSRRKGAPPFLVKPSLGGTHDEGELEKLRRSLPAPFVRRALLGISAFAVLDDTIEAELRALGVAENRIFRVNNGINRHAFAAGLASERAILRRDFDLPANAAVVVYAGQLSERKGIRELLGAWSNLADRTHGAFLLLCGDGPLRGEVLAAQSRDASVRWLGVLPSIAPVLRCADVLILPSRAESFGNVVVEALSSGVPVAATQVGVVPALVAPGRNGWLMDEVSTSAVQATLQQVLAERDRWSALGANGSEAVRHLDFVTIAENYREIYNELRRRGDIGPADPACG